MLAKIVVGLGYGDEGKGSWVDHLTRELAPTFICRFNGGSQAGHNVVTPDGRHHNFNQFGSGMFVDGVKTLLSRFMLVDPDRALYEAGLLSKLGIIRPLERLVVSDACPVITPFNRLINRIEEVARGNDRHGSCGFGIGVTQRDVETIGDEALYVRDILSDSFASKLWNLHQRKVNEAAALKSAATTDLIDRLNEIDLVYYFDLFRHFASRVRIVPESDFPELLRQGNLIFEGAQGVLLDEMLGFAPHVTWSKTGFSNALQLLNEAAFDGEVERIGLLRAYGTRHGAGPFVTEDPELSIPACHNQLNPWQGEFRLGWFDCIAARYAIEATGGLNTLAITNVDRLSGPLKVCTSYHNGDARYFSEQRIHILNTTYDEVCTRTGTMNSIVPGYTALSVMEDKTPSCIERFMSELESVLQHPIHAYSATADHRKVYRSDQRSASGPPRRASFLELQYEFSIF